MKNPVSRILPTALALASCANLSHAGLIGYWKLDETSGTTAADSVGTNTGINASGVTVNQTGIAGKAFYFDGTTNGRVGIKAANGTDPASFLTALNAAASPTLTMSVWVKTSDIPNTKTALSICNNGASDTYYALAVYKTSGVARGTVRNNPTQTNADGSTNVANGNWHHIATTIVVSGGGRAIKTYVDGVLEKSTSSSAAAPTGLNNVEIGRLGRSGPADFFTGLIDDVQLYNTVLSGADIQSLYAHPGFSLNQDTDGDGMPDTWEIAHGTDPNVNDAAVDNDSNGGPDGLSNLEEFIAGTDPQDSDTDNDGLSDGDEVKGLIVSGYFSDPLSADGDNDGVSDVNELNGSLNTAFANAPTNPLSADTDGDGVSDFQELNGTLNTAFANTPTNPNLADTDGDGHNDFDELTQSFDPNDDQSHPLELIGYWKLDESSGSTAADAIGSNIGTIGTGATLNQTGVAGGAYYFDGTTNGNVVIGNASFLAGLNNSHTITMSAWVKSELTVSPPPPGGLSGQTAISISASDSNYYDLYIKGTDGLPRGTMRNGTPTSNASGSNFLDLQWHHMATTMVVSGTDSTIKLYVDGALVATKSEHVVPGAVNNVEIGRLGRSSNPVDFFKGLIDDVQLYKTVLSDADIKNLYDHPGYSLAELEQDTDGDGMPDYWEIANGTDPNVDDAAVDNDSDGGADGLTNLQEFIAGTDPQDSDTDDDTLSDGDELNGLVVSGYFSNPLLADSDGDGASDPLELNGTLNTAFGNALTNPNLADTDGDGLTDGYELTCNSPGTALDPNDDGSIDPTQAPGGDRDSDGLLNLEEFDPLTGLNTSSPQTRADLADTDGDGYSDAVEDNTHVWSSILNTGTNPVVADSDGDGIPDGDENPDSAYVAGINSGSDPNLADTDGDGYNDNDEFSQGFDPSDDQDHPGQDYPAPRVTGAAFNGLGEFVIDFIGKPNTNYQATKSPDLATPFAPLTIPLTVSTDGSGIGQATIPASEASESKEFYRMEEAE